MFTIERIFFTWERDFACFLLWPMNLRFWNGMLFVMHFTFDHTNTYTLSTTKSVWHLSNTPTNRCLNVVEDTEIQLFVFHTVEYDRVEAFTVSPRARFLADCPRVPFLWQSVDIFYLDTNLYRIQFFEGFQMNIWMSVADALYRFDVVVGGFFSFVPKIESIVQLNQTRLYKHRCFFSFVALYKTPTVKRASERTSSFVSVFAALIWFLIDKIHNNEIYGARLSVARVCFARNNK